MKGLFKATLMYAGAAFITMLVLEVVHKNGYEKGYKDRGLIDAEAVVFCDDENWKDYIYTVESARNSVRKER